MLTNRNLFQDWCLWAKHTAAAVLNSCPGLSLDADSISTCNSLVTGVQAGSRSPREGEGEAPSKIPTTRESVYSSLIPQSHPASRSSARLCTPVCSLLCSLSCPGSLFVSPSIQSLDINLIAMWLSVGYVHRRRSL